MIPTDQRSSNILYAGNVRDFEEAMRLVARQCEEEMFYSDEDGHIQHEASLRSFAAVAHSCAAEHADAMRRAERELARKWLASDDEDVRRIREALMELDYTILAI
jgi:transcriptional regulator with PAS, ATPase and Fis domain